MFVFGISYGVGYDTGIGIDIDINIGYSERCCWARRWTHYILIHFDIVESTKTSKSFLVEHEVYTHKSRQT